MLASRHLTFSKRLTRTLSTRASNVLHALGLPTSGELQGVYDGEWKGDGPITRSICPTTGELLATVRTASDQQVYCTIQKAREAYRTFRNCPAPKRGEILRQIRDEISAKRDDLGALVSLEMGKIKTEGIGEVREFVDIVSRVPLTLRCSL